MNRKVIVQKSSLTANRNQKTLLKDRGMLWGNSKKRQGEWGARQGRVPIHEVEDTVCPNGFRSYGNRGIQTTIHKMKSEATTSGKREMTRKALDLSKAVKFDKNKLGRKGTILTRKAVISLNRTKTYSPPEGRRLWSRETMGGREKGVDG